MEENCMCCLYGKARRLQTGKLDKVNGFTWSHFQRERLHTISRVTIHCHLLKSAEVERGSSQSSHTKQRKHGSEAEPVISFVST